MAKRGVTRTFFGSILNFRSNIAYDELSAHARVIKSSLKDIFTKEQITPEEVHQRDESFEEAMHRLGLTEKDVQANTRYRLFNTCFYLFLGACLGYYTTYLFAIKLILASSATLVLAVLLVVNAFKEHFWYMQMKRHKLNCTINDWIKFIIRKEDKKNEIAPQ